MSTVRNNNMNFTFRIDGLKDRLVELEDTILELQEQQKDLLAVRSTIEDVIGSAADRLAEAQREILCDAEDCVINVMEAVGLDAGPSYDS